MVNIASVEAIIRLDMILRLKQIKETYQINKKHFDLIAISLMK